jgi:pentatricopeptide repeat protein
VPAERIDFRLRTRYVDTKANTIDEALEIIDRSHKAGKPISVGLLGNAAEVFAEMVKRGIRPDASPTRPRPMIPSTATSRRLDIGRMGGEARLQPAGRGRPPPWPR